MTTAMDWPLLAPLTEDARAAVLAAARRRSFAAGEVVFGPGVAERVLAFLSSPPDAADLSFPELTPRERQILDLIAAGRSNAEIGRSLGFAAKTIANNVSRIFAKLQVADRTQAIIRARDAGLGRERT